VTSSPAFIRLLRPRQWVKNAFIVAPLFFTPAAWTKSQSVAVLLTVIVFCFLSSTVYVINDYADREADGLHPEKKKRPIASGEISPAGAIAIAAVLFAVAAALAIGLLPHAVVIVAGLYFAINLLYSFGLKHVSILDVLIVAAGFVLRVDAGAAAIEVEPTVWIVVCTGLLALFLGLGKRRGELVLVESRQTPGRRALDGYSLPVVDQLVTVVASATIVVYALYTFSARDSRTLMITIPYVVFGIFRYLLILHRDGGEEPDRILMTDRPILGSVALWACTCGLILLVD